MKRITSLFTGLLFVTGLSAQQLADYTQYPALTPMLNPAYTGTRGTIDARLNYRTQWVGFDDAPVQQTALVHSRFLKGMVGLGAMLSNDVTGPSRRFTYGFTAAFHLRFPDVEFSAGIGLNFTKYTFNTADLTQHWAGDPAFAPGLSTFDKRKNPTAGLLLYNDRFHFGLGLVNLLQSKYELGETRVKNENHYYFTFGYNFHEHPDYVWENNLFATYVDGLPITVNYNLRLHIREKIIAGIAWRMRDAVALQAGMVFFNDYQFVYSYDLGISKLRGGHTGSHEITLGYRFDYNKRGGKYKNFDSFQKQKYHLF
jgi:type IX secretion system PorP/SprF family membrane protein